MIRFNGIMNEVATFEADSPVEAGVPVALSGNGKVAAAEASALFCGVAVNHSRGLQGVQLRGYAELTYSGTAAPAVGYNLLAADGSGGVKVVEEAGRQILAVNVDTAKKIVGVIL